MNDSKWERSGAFGGVAFVVLLGIAGVLGGEPPAATASESEISDYLADHQAALKAGVWLLGLASMALIWWFGSLWRRMVRAEGGTSRLAVVSLIGLAVAGPLALMSAVVLAATALHIDEVGESAPLLYRIGGMLMGVEGFGLATHLLAANMLGARTRTLPLWLVGLGLVSALFFLLSAVPSASSVDVNSSLGLLAFVIWCVWVVSVSYFIWSDTSVSPLAEASK
ncbi:MAG: hypothetical protein AB7T37_00710 [Dehalococcoidia bacterium]